MAAYRDVRERDLTGRQGLLIAEGEVVLRLVVRQRRYPVVSLLIAEKRLPQLADVLDALPSEVPVYVAAQPVMDAIAGFHLHRGILGIAQRPPAVSVETLLAGLGQESLVVALYGISNHDNMGGIFRNAAAFGADAVILSGDCCDPLYRKAIRVSVGTALTVPFARLEGDDDGLAAFARHGLTVFAFGPSGGLTLAQLAPQARAVLLFGAEGPGLSPAIMARAAAVRIPMAAGVDSLNVATTSGIALHHFSQRAATREPPEAYRER